MSLEKIAGTLLVAGGAAIATSLLLTSGSFMPDWRPLSEDKENGYTGKYGEKYNKYLVGVSESTKDGSKYKDINNQTWWEWIFKNRYESKKGTLNDKFSTVDKVETLKSICKEAYGSNLNGDGKIKETITGTESDKFSESNIWLFCSPAETKPKSILDNENYSGSLVSDTTKKKLLISITSEEKGNKWFWEQKQKEFSTSNGEVKSIKDWCKNSYNTTITAASNTNPSITEENVFKWCSLEGKNGTTV